MPPSSAMLSGGGGAAVAAESEGGLRVQAIALSGPSAKVLLVCGGTADEGRHRSTLFYLLKMSGGGLHFLLMRPRCFWTHRKYVRPAQTAFRGLFGFSAPILPITPGASCPGAICQTSSASITPPLLASRQHFPPRLRVCLGGLWLFVLLSDLHWNGYKTKGRWKKENWNNTQQNRQTQTEQTNHKNPTQQLGFESGMLWFLNRVRAMLFCKVVVVFLCFLMLFSCFLKAFCEPLTSVLFPECPLALFHKCCVFKLWLCPHVLLLFAELRLCLFVL